jgi:hypothetical protein
MFPKSFVIAGIVSPGYDKKSTATGSVTFPHVERSSLSREGETRRIPYSPLRLGLLGSLSENRTLHHQDNLAE